MREECRCRGRGVYAMRNKIATTKFGGRATFILQKNLGRTCNFRLEVLRTSRSAQNLLRRVRIGLLALALRRKPKIGEPLALLHQSSPIQCGLRALTPRRKP